MTRRGLGIAGLMAFAYTPVVAQTGEARLTAAHPMIIEPSALKWRKLPQFDDGRERAELLGVPEEGGTWVYRVRLSQPVRIEAHTHPVDELITVLAGHWSIGFGTKFDAAKLVTLAPGSFVRIPADTPHFVATGEGTTIIQSSGTGVFKTDPIK